MPQKPVKTNLFVSQLVAGAGISLSPDEGTGIVTVTNTEGDPGDVAITGGTIDGTVIGGTTPAAGSFTAVHAANIAGADSTLDIVGSNGVGSAGTGGEVTVQGGLGGNGTGAGGPLNLVGGSGGGGTTGDGGPVNLTGGAAIASNANGGSVVLGGGAKTGSGIAGGIRLESIVLKSQGAPAAKTTSGVLAVADVLAGIITVNQGAAGASAQQLPLAASLQAALPADMAVNDSFDFSVINISTNAAEPASLTTNTGWTLVGDMDVAANSAATTKSAGRFRVRYTGTGAFTLYRLS